MGLFRRRRHLMDSFDPAPPIPNDRPLSVMDDYDDWGPWLQSEPTVGPSTPSGASDAYRPPPNRLIRAFAELIAGIDRTVQIGGNLVLNDAIGIPYARVRGELTPDGLWPAESYERVIRQHLGV